ncbi:SURF1 family cytochrome oxidase biogenesis protein [Gulosibacter bifidus]|uniref:SURF1-like protein n=1 Tax=Gulosibacter bifidus TaxID=272239 RepID=A0ABW5RHQ5_9MICO|nr:SURF1 family cytochrome oxidase biogenesis protein [Gulosibacter bifidus]
MLKTACKPKWLAILLLALAVISAFVWLSKWQLDSAFNSATAAADESAYKTRVPLGDLVEPSKGLVEESAARPASVTGHLVAGDYAIVDGRIQDGETGVWVVGHFAVTNDGVQDFADAPGIPLAIGWAPDDATANQAIEALDARGDASAALDVKVEAGQSPESARNETDPQRILSMAPGQLINTWQTPAPAYYSAWLLHESGLELPEGLQTIHAVDIDTSTQIDLLNIFYAIEWIVFAVMALYVWFRLVRDDYLNDQHERSDAVVAEQVRRELLRELARDRKLGTGGGASAADAATSDTATDRDHEENE